MAPIIKLQRVGTSKQPKYRVVVQEARQKLSGKVIEILGIYHPRQNPTLFEVSKEKVLAWISKGAQPTNTVRILLGKAGILPKVDTSNLPKRKAKKAVAEAAAAPLVAAVSGPETPAPKAEASPA